MKSLGDAHEEQKRISQASQEGAGRR